MKYYFLRFRRGENRPSGPEIIDAGEDFERDRISGRIVYRKPSLKERLLLALELLGGAALTAGLFLILLPIAILIAVALASLLLAFLVVVWWRLRRHRNMTDEFRLSIERFLGRR